MIPPKYYSQDCKENRHEDCDGWVPRGYDEPYDHPCDDDCHKPEKIADHISKRFGRAIERLSDDLKV